MQCTAITGENQKWGLLCEGYDGAVGLLQSEPTFVVN